MILSDELRLFVERQKNAILVAFSNYAACSQISYNQQTPVWEELGKEICPTYEALVEQFKTEFEEMKKEEEESDIPEVDDDEEDEYASSPTIFLELQFCLLISNPILRSRVAY